MNDFYQHDWDVDLERDFDRLLDIAQREDCDPVIGDLTGEALIPTQAEGCATIHARQPGVVAGLRAVPVILRKIDPRLAWGDSGNEGRTVSAGERIGAMSGPARSLLIAERPVLNLIGRLSGIATLTRRYVEVIRDTRAKIYDTRKTTLGWRRLEKYAVRLGGGRNHRTGLFDAVLIKDNHLAFGAEGRFTPAVSVRIAREYLASRFGADTGCPVLEIEVDTLAQLAEVLPERPDIVLLDNMPPGMMREAVTLRDALAPATELEASGGIDLNTVRSVAETGVERISVGALTHSAVAFDFGLDWGPGAGL